MYSIVALFPFLSRVLFGLLRILARRAFALHDLSFRMAAVIAHITCGNLPAGPRDTGTERHLGALLADRCCGRHCEQYAAGDL